MIAASANQTSAMEITPPFGYREIVPLHKSSGVMLPRRVPARVHRDHQRDAA
jgi:hypothetical protein